MPEISLDLGPTSTPPSLEGMTSQEKIETMMEWFGENFEDPVHSTPYNSREGGYQFIWGGPYDAADELRTVFSGEATDDEIEEAASNLEGETSEWAPSSNRIVQDAEFEEEVGYLRDDGRRMDAVERARIAIDDLDRVFQEFKHDHGGIGHNRPPGSIQHALTGDIAKIEQAIEIAQQELPKTAPEVSGAAKLLQSALDGLKSTGTFLGKETLKEFAKQQLIPRINEAIHALTELASLMF